MIFKVLGALAIYISVNVCGIDWFIAESVWHKALLAIAQWSVFWVSQRQLVTVVKIRPRYYLSAFWKICIAFLRYDEKLKTKHFIFTLSDSHFIYEKSVTMKQSYET